MNSKYTIVLLVFSLLITACQKEDQNNKFKSAVTEALKVIDSKTLENVAQEKVLDTLCNYLSKHKNDSVKRNLLFKLANKYYYIDKYEKYLEIVKNIHNLSIETKDSTHIAKALCFTGDYYEQKSLLDSAFKYYSQSEKLYRILKDTLNTGRTKLYKSGILLDAGIFSESEIQSIAALKLLSKTNKTRSIYEAYNFIAISLDEQNDFKNALKYYNLAFKQLTQLEKENFSKKKILKSKLSWLNNVGRVYEKLKNYRKAIQYYNRGLQTENLKQNYPKLYAMLLDNFCYSKMKAGDFKGVNKDLFESLKIRDSLNDLSGIASCKINIGEYYLHQKDSFKALSYIKQGLMQSKKIKRTPHIIASLKLLMENDSKNKSYYTNEYLRITDSLQKVERITRNKFARIAYETDLVEEKNQVLSKQITYIIGITSLIMLLLSVFFIIYRLKSKNRELLLVQDQQAANEKIYQLMLKQQSETEQARNEERNRIAMELHDGIVNSVFTTRFSLIQLDTTQTGKKEQLIKELEKTENEIRRVSHDLTQNLLFEDKSFPEMIINLVDSQRTQNNTQFDVSVDKFIDWSSVSSDKKIHIFRIIQEAIQNSNKYSKAERCFILLLKTGDTITIRVWDNGIGFNPEKVKYGIGLRNIKERTNALNGKLKISSNSEKGTTIEVTF